LLRLVLCNGAALNWRVAEASIAVCSGQSLARITVTKNRRRITNSTIDAHSGAKSGIWRNTSINHSLSRIRAKAGILCRWAGHGGSAFGTGCCGVNAANTNAVIVAACLRTGSLATIPTSTASAARSFSAATDGSAAHSSITGGKVSTRRHLDYIFAPRVTALSLTITTSHYILLSKFCL
jgi:hypothetical protein